MFNMRFPNGQYIASYSGLVIFGENDSNALGRLIMYRFSSVRDYHYAYDRVLAGMKGHRTTATDRTLFNIWK